MMFAKAMRWQCSTVALLRGNICRRWGESLVSFFCHGIGISAGLVHSASREDIKVQKLEEMLVLLLLMYRSFNNGYL